MRALVAMSGGVDSSVAAALSVAAGYDTEGVTMLLWGGDRVGRSCSTADESEAAAAAAALGIPHRSIDFTEEFNEVVITPFINAARTGVTTNPCVSCNAKFKVEHLFDYARAHGFDRVITGHHARVITVNGQRRIARSVDDAKDQSYVIHMLTGENLDMLELPLGELTKDEVRRIAVEAALPAADTPDSMDLCFSPADVITDAGELTGADIVDTTGKTVGHTDNLELLTIGQRRGLGVAVGVPVFITRIDAAGQRVTVGTEDELNCASTPVTNIGGPDPACENMTVQSSAHGNRLSATLEADELVWAQPRRRIAPGQACVFYTTAPDGTEYVTGWATAS